MDPQKLADIVSSLGLAAFACWLLQLVMTAVAARTADRPLLRRVAG